MSHLITWILAIYGLSNIVVISKIFSPVRIYFLIHKRRIFVKIGELLSCMMCFGFWAGAFLYLIGFQLSNNIFIDAVTGSGICWLLHGVAYKLMSYEYSRQHPPAQ